MPMVGGPFSSLYVGDAQSTDRRRRTFRRVVSANSYLDLPGSGGAFVSTPHTADLNLTADMELIFRARMTDWSPTNQTMISKGNSPRRYQLAFAATSWGMWNGTTYASRSQSALTDATTYWLRLTLVSGSLSHFYAADQASIPTSWTQVGAAQAWSLGSTNTETLTLGSVGTGELLNGRIYRAIVRSSVDGTTVADFNPNLYSTGSTFTSTDGRVYTLNGTAAITKA